MPSSSTQAACSSSRSFSDFAEAYARHVMRLVQTLRQVVEAATHSAGYFARHIGEMLRLIGNSARTILKTLGRPIQNEQIAVSSPQGAAVFSNPKYRDSHVQLLEQIARGNRYTDVNSLALMISRRRRIITNWERGDVRNQQVHVDENTGTNKGIKVYQRRGRKSCSKIGAVDTGDAATGS